jgi:hypothetical protein
MKRKNNYIPGLELIKGATLTAGACDTHQKAVVIDNRVTVAGKSGIIGISGTAAGRRRNGKPSSAGLALSSFTFTRPDGSVRHIRRMGLDIRLKAGQSAGETAEMLSQMINSGLLPYKAAASENQDSAEVVIIFTGDTKT